MPQPKIALATVLREVGNAIREANAEASIVAAKDPTKQPVMSFKECEVEFGLEIELKVSGGIKLWVLELGGGRSRTESNTIKVTYSAHGESLVAQGLSEDSNLSPAKRQVKRTKETK